MAWTTPKTDWNEDSFIGVDDVNRWNNNLLYLRELATHLYAPQIAPWWMDEKRISYYYAWYHLYSDEMNLFETKLTEINNGTLQYDIGEQKTYSDNGAMPDYNELNRIESAMLRLYTEMTIQHNNLDRLAFTLGGERKFKI